MGPDRCKIIVNHPAFVIEAKHIKHPSHGLLKEEPGVIFGPSPCGPPPLAVSFYLCRCTRKFGVSTVLYIRIDRIPDIAGRIVRIIQVDADNRAIEYGGPHPNLIADGPGDCRQDRQQAYHRQADEGASGIFFGKKPN